MATMTEVEPLGGRIEVMELEGTLTTQVPTDDAAPARFFNQFPLDNLPAPPRRFSSTLYASVVATTLEHELGAAMPYTAPFYPRSIARRTRLP